MDEFTVKVDLNAVWAAAYGAAFANHIAALVRHKRESGDSLADEAGVCSVYHCRARADYHATAVATAAVAGLRDGTVEVGSR